MGAKESITFVLDVEDKASKAFVQKQIEIKRAGEAVEQLGGKSQKSAQFVSDLSDAIDNEALSDMASHASSAFSAVEALGEGVVALKEKLAGVSGVAIGAGLFGGIGLVAGLSALNNAIDRVAKLREEGAKLDEQFVRLKDLRMEGAERTVAGVEDELKQLNATIELQKVLVTEQITAANLLDQESRERIQAELDGIKQLKTERQGLFEEIARLKRQEERDKQARGEQQQAILEQLKFQRDLVGLTDKQRATKEMMMNLEKAHWNEGMRLINERFAKTKRQQEVDRANQERERARQREEAEQERLANILDRQAESLQAQVIALRDGQAAATAYRLRLQGVGNEDAKRIARLQEQLAGLTAPSQFASVTSLRGATSRLLRGGGVAANSQEKLVGEVRKQTQLTAEQTAALSRMAGEIASLARKFNGNDLAIVKVGN